MRILITGSQGQVGSLLEKKLRDECELLAVGREKLDISDRNSVIEIVTNFKPDYIINAAAYTAVDKAESEEALAFAINSDGPSFLAEAANRIGAVILHISTDYVFDGNDESIYTENMSVGPQGIYGKSKLAGEKAIAEKTDKYIILRTAWVFGECGHNFVKTMLRIVKERDSIAVVGDQYGGPTYAGDIADTLIKMVESIASGKHSRWGIYHYTGMPYVSWYEFAEAIFSQALEHTLIKKVPSLSSIPSSAYPTPAKRPKNSRLDCTKIKEQFDIEPSDWKLALKEISNYK
ncbi:MULTISPECIES: dTDP-4-dehydrorhamnose reductase [Rahnella]|uniref:dTDP-4-dehydrorhamnose reductase n=1 Tax=Rahnella laticis TaxID=2787622 RepID=A0ABS0E834_9GAMM|nr:MULTISPECIES: dTDP-4-dehydrorhamnose reductase [Rahnella]MBF7980268.1 dTDP-4-dehydrorhamnose reductase [Rahnella laticis]MBF8000473.1 dTDP-4-dehydrorhamnose reductase [Rahnella sp. LAC-M12]